MTLRPPLFARILLALFVPKGPARNGVMGDLHEMYAERRVSDGSLRAALWYWIQAIQAASRYAAERPLNRFRKKALNRGHKTRNAGILETLIQDIRFASRTLLKAPVFTVVAALTIAIGIGATTTIFSVVNSVLLKPPPGVRNANELVRPHRIDEDGSSYHEWSYPSFLEYKAAESGLSDLAAMAITAVGIENDEIVETTIAVFVSHNFFGMIGVRPALGRLFLPDEDDPANGDLVAVLGHSLWERRFGGDS